MLKLENQLCFAIYSASHAFTKTYKPLLTKLGVTYPQYLVLMVLWEKRSATVSGIGEQLGLDSGTLSPLLKRLEKTGFIKRERSKEDERQVSIHLTPAGLAARSEAAAIGKEIFRATGCKAEEMADLRRSIVALRNRLEAA
jgi:DNA-binding MarR family transcriptional regulator